MTTPRQIAANRANAKLSTGPRTSAGKALVKLNAVRHGLTASAAVVPGIERESDWESFRAGVVESLRPVGRMAEVLAGRAAEILWRMQRATRHESLSIAASQAELQIPARPKSDAEALVSMVREDQDAMTDGELLAHREEQLVEERESLARVRRAAALAHRLSTLKPADVVAEDDAQAYVGEAVGRAEELGLSARLERLDDDPAAVRAAAGLADGQAWTVAAVNRAVAHVARGLNRKRTAAEFTTDVLKAIIGRLEDAHGDVAESEAEARALRQRRDISAAIAVARRAGITGKAAQSLARYEAHLSRQLQSTLDQFERANRLAGGGLGGPPAPV